jgi:hypothetical protein
VHYRNRLNTAIGIGGWAIKPIESHIADAGNKSTIFYKGQLWIRGKYVSEAVGEQEYYKTNGAMTYATAYEAAKSNCLVRCCKDLGMFSELWDKQWLAANTKGGSVKPEPKVNTVNYPAHANRPTQAPNANVSRGGMAESVTGMLAYHEEEFTAKSSGRKMVRGIASVGDITANTINGELRHLLEGLAGKNAMLEYQKTQYGYAVLNVLPATGGEEVYEFPDAPPPEDLF